MRRLGFTLLELLVVIAVIAILSAVIAPSLQKTKESARDVVCSNHLKQLSQGVLAYTHDTNFFPHGFNGITLSTPPGGFLGNAITDYQGWWWFHYSLDESLISDTETAQSPLWCPSRRLPSSLLSNNILCSNYGINYAICKIYSQAEQTDFKGMPLKSERIRSTSTTLLLMDAGYSLISWKALIEDTDTYPFENPQRQGAFFLPGLDLNTSLSIDSDQEEDAWKGRHTGKRVNVNFADGHVENKKTSELDVQADDENISGLGPWTP